MVYEKIREMVSEQFHVDVKDITMETSFRNDFNADSLDLVELIMAIEDEFEIEIDDKVVERIETVGEAVNYIMGVVS